MALLDPDAAIWLVLRTSRRNRPPVFESAWFTEAEAQAAREKSQKLRLLTDEVVTAALEDDPPPPLVYFVEKFDASSTFHTLPWHGIPANCRANLILRRRLGAVTTGPAKPTIVGLTREGKAPPPGSKATDYAFIAPASPATDAVRPMCSACRQEMTLQLQAQVGLLASLNAPKRFACLWTCCHEGCSKAWDVNVTWHDTDQAASVIWAVPWVECPDYPIPSVAVGRIDGANLAHRYGTADGWKIGGYPCWQEIEPAVECECGSTPVFCFQVATAWQPDKADLSDAVFILVFVCKCGRTQVIRDVS